VTSATSCSKELFVNVHAQLTRFLLPIVFLFLAGAAGCGRESNEVSVQGRVMFRGEPLPGGSITFFPESGRPVMAVIAEDGNYSAEMPPGEYVVAVGVGTELPPGFKEGDPIPPPKVVLPPEYTTRAKSSLTATVRQGDEQPTNFELK
jgi:hypothetical protein